MVSNHIQGLRYTWIIDELPCSEEVLRIANKFNISEPIASIIYKRGYKKNDEIESFLRPTHKKFFYDPFRLLNAENAIKRIQKAIENKEKILISGDYDVDGVTSTSLLMIALKSLGATVNFFLPHRTRDGYGISPEVIEKAKNSGYSLIITVDNGTTAFEALKKAYELKIDVIVTDHHKPQGALEGALYLVNPHQEQCKYPFKGLAGVGVAFKLVCLLYEFFGKDIPIKVYELFAIGTVADLVPLSDENRYLVQHALSKINKDFSYALSLLKKNANIPQEKKIKSEDIAFFMAPQINALGRLDDPRNGVLFFINEDKRMLEKISEQFLFFNKKRKEIEKKIFDEILCDIKNKPHPHEKGCIVRASKRYPAGIIGIVAAKINHEYGVPVCIFNESESGILKGSCRSIPACDIFNILGSIDKEIIISFGGHKAAAGLSISKSNFDAFERAFSKEILKICSKKDFDLKITVDRSLEVEDINKRLWSEISLLEPFGMNNLAPVFLIKNVLIVSFKVIKEINIKMIISSCEKELSVIFFNRVDIVTCAKKNKSISIVGKISENTYKNNSSIEIHGLDILFN